MEHFKKKQENSVNSTYEAWLSVPLCLIFGLCWLL